MHSRGGKEATVNSSFFKSVLSEKRVPGRKSSLKCGELWKMTKSSNHSLVLKINVSRKRGEVSREVSQHIPSWSLSTSMKNSLHFVKRWWWNHSLVGVEEKEKNGDMCQVEGNFKLMTARVENVLRCFPTFSSDFILVGNKRFLRNSEFLLFYSDLFEHKCWKSLQKLCSSLSIHKEHHYA